MKNMQLKHLIPQVNFNRLSEIDFSSIFTIRMVAITIWLTLLTGIHTANSQAPEAFNYQAVWRDASGNIKTNTPVEVRIDILQGSATGTSVYAESFNTSSNAFGLINLQIGKGTVLSGTFAYIRWGDDTYFIKVTVNGAIISISQLLSVPYALHSYYADYVNNVNYNHLTNKPIIDDVFKHNLYNSSSFNQTTTGQYNVALGTASMLYNSSGFYNIAIGYCSLRSNTNGSENIALGSQALYSNTSGNYNMAMGFKALNSNTSGTLNIALGKSALLSNNVGSNNIALGSQALYNNTSGEDNIAIGGSSLYDNRTGKNNLAIGRSSLILNRNSNNIAIGNWSLENNYTGNCNTAVGISALQTNHNGSQNVAIGDSALKYNYSGKWNVAVGNKALYNNEAGDKNTALGTEALRKCLGWDNTAIGYQSMLSNISGFDNTATGVNALSVNTTGDGNTAMGKNAMDSQVTGNNNTAIGFNSDVAEGASNATAIGYDAYVNASNKIVLGNVSATTIGGFGSWSNYSDRRLKENISYSNQLGLNFINLLKPASYNYINDNHKRRRDGLIAQDVQQALKELGLEFSGLIADNDNDKTLNLAYAEFVMPLINAVQELSQTNQKLIENEKDLKEQMTHMKEEIELLKQRIMTTK